MPFIIGIFTTAFLILLFLGVLGRGPFVRPIRAAGKAIAVVAVLGVVFFFYNFADSLSWGWMVVFFVILAMIGIPVAKLVVRTNG